MGRTAEAREFSDRPSKEVERENALLLGRLQDFITAGKLPFGELTLLIDRHRIYRVRVGPTEHRVLPEGRLEWLPPGILSEV